MPNINMPTLQEGMLVFQTLPKTGLAKTIADATNSDILYVGILHQRSDGVWIVAVQN